MRRRSFVPEVIQTSAMDCGPASLKALLEGFGISASYGRLREACFTAVDGTSIDQIEDAAVRLGLDAEQIMIPVDHLLLDESTALPAMVVVRTSSGATHFVVAWRRWGGRVQVMDPGSGRQWRAAGEFLSEVYVHSQRVPADAWRSWAGSPDFLRPLEARLRALRLSASTCRKTIASAVADPTPHTLAALDAATRLVESLASEGAVDRGAGLAVLIDRLVRRPHMVPDRWWSARVDRADAELIMLRGAVLLRVKGVRADVDRRSSALSQEFADALTERPRVPLVDLWRTMRTAGWTFPAALSAAVVLAAALVVAEAIVLRGFFDLTRSLAGGPQRWWAIGLLALFFGTIAVVETVAARAVLQSGRRFEGTLRLEFLTKIPRLADAYFRSRLISDMADRAHAMHRLRDLPALLAAAARAACGLVFTVIGIAWLYPESVIPAAAAAAVAIAVPLVAQPWLIERDLRARSHAGALSRFSLDALLGLTAVRAHGAARAIRHEHHNLLVEWGRAALIIGRSTVGVQTLQATLCLLIVVWLLLARYAIHGDTGGLLLVYWALSIPVLGQELAALACHYPRLRNTLLRVTEPLGAREEAVNDHEVDVASTENGVAIAIDHVSVCQGGHNILEDIDLSFAPGEHVAIVGTSGAGKSSLAGLLLGWYTPSSGAVRIDGDRMDAATLAGLRRSTAWVSSQVQLWNAPLFENLRYGAGADAMSMGATLECAELTPVLEKLPLGMQTTLGEGGRLLSGGEGQRVRFARGLQRSGVRLVVLDEAFRGLERDRRRTLLDAARRRWAHATLLNITHEIDETWRFDRVIVVEGGRIVEDGSPKSLYRELGSRYRALLDASDRARDRVWSDPDWRVVTLEDGRLREQIPVARAEEVLA